MRYPFVIEQAPSNVAGYFPDVPGCVAAAHTIEELLTLAREALALHLQDEPELPHARSLREIASDPQLELAETDLLATVEYQHEQTLAPA